MRTSLLLLLSLPGCAMTAQMHGGAVATAAAKPSEVQQPVWPEGMFGAEAIVSVSDHVGFGMEAMARAGPEGGSLAGGLEVCAVPMPGDNAFVLFCLGDHLLDVGYRFEGPSLALASPFAHAAVAFDAGGVVLFVNGWGGWDAAIVGKPSRAWAGLSIGIGLGYNAYGKDKPKLWQ